MAHNQLLMADVQAALQISNKAGREGQAEHRIYGRQDMPTLLHGVYGLGSKDFTRYDAAAVTENMKRCLDGKGEQFHHNFFSGIEGPYTLKPIDLPDYRERELGITFIGIGAEGVKTALETAALVYSQDKGEGCKYIQSGARYGAARKGSAVFMNMRISNHPIRDSSQLTEHDILAFFNEKFASGHILQEYAQGLKKKGLFVINSPRSTEEILASFPAHVQNLIEERQVKLVAIDATRAALKHLNRNLPGAAILGLINKEKNILAEEDFEARLKSVFQEKMGLKKGKEVIESNIALLKYGASRVRQGLPAEIDQAIDTTCVPQEVAEPENFGQKNRAAGLPVSLTRKDEMGTVKPVNLVEDYQGKFHEEIVQPIVEGKKVPWDKFMAVVPAATSRYRDMSHVGTQLPLYNPSRCTACGLCVASCPDSALYCSITDQPIPEDAKSYFKVFKKVPRGLPWEKFAMNIEVIPESCKGCTICVQVCPTDALKMVDKLHVAETDFLPVTYKDLDRTLEAAVHVNRMALNHQILFVFSKLYPGRHTLCPGCSEGTIGLLTFFAAESLRNNPQGIATFYQGIKILSEQNRRAIDHMLDYGFNLYTINATGCSEVSELGNPFNDRIYQSGHYGFGTASASALGAKFSFDQAYMNGRSDMLSKIIVFAGDGAIYDIGNGPFNYALGENYDITWVIYNNEGYMNTGAQKSGATRYGCDRSTSPMGQKIGGKTTLHRRIISQAMGISHVYAAKLSIDNPFYAIKILKEAIAYSGPSVVEFFSVCPQGHQTHDWAGPLLSRMMVESRKWQVAVRRPFQRLDISANPEPESVYPSEGRSFKKKIKREPATFYDVVSMLGQYNRHIKTHEGDDIPEIVLVNETVSLFRWLRNQYQSGYRDTMPSEEEVERMVAERYRF